MADAEQLIGTLVAVGLVAGVAKGTIRLLDDKPLKIGFKDTRFI